MNESVAAGPEKKKKKPGPEPKYPAKKWIRLTLEQEALIERWAVRLSVDWTTALRLLIDRHIPDVDRPAEDEGTAALWKGELLSMVR